MFQFTTTTIINSATDSNGSTSKFTGSSSKLVVTRVGTFLKANIVSITKNPYKAGVKEVARVTIPTITSGLVARVEVDVRLSMETNSDYASSHMYFSKPVTVEVIATGTAATDATNLAAQINALKDRFGHSYVTASTDSAYLIITAKENFQRIYSIKVLQEAGYTGNSLVEPKYTDVSASTFSVTTAGNSGFGDTQWMISRVMNPSAANTDYFGINKSEFPIMGGQYTQYTIRYSIDKDIDDSIVAPGKSITTHVFYVLSSLVSSFETELAKLSVSYKLAITGTPTTIDISDGDTCQTVVTGNVGPVTYSSSAVAKATVSATGLVEPVAAGEAIVTVTDSVGQTATITFTVTA